MQSGEDTALSTLKRNEFSRLFLYMRLITNTSTSRLTPWGMRRGLLELVLDLLIFMTIFYLVLVL